MMFLFNQWTQPDEIQNEIKNVNNNGTVQLMVQYKPSTLFAIPSANQVPDLGVGLLQGLAVTHLMLTSINAILQGAQ